jgi:membrane protease YdiL (CAAX protease family)
VTPGIRFPSILLLFLGGLFCAFLTWALARSLGVPNVPSEWIFAFANEIYWIAGYYWLSYDRGWITLRGRFAPAPRRALLLAASAAFAIMAFFLAVATILQKLGVELKEIPEIDLLHGARTTLPFVFVLIVILAPIAEELLCRGLLLDWLRQRMPIALSIAVSALIFGLLHGIRVSSGTSGWLQFGYRVVLGAAAGLLAVRYRSLLPSFVMHAVNNCVVVLAASQTG